MKVWIHISLTGHHLFTPLILDISSKQRSLKTIQTEIKSLQTDLMIFKMYIRITKIFIDHIHWTDLPTCSKW